MAVDARLPSEEIYESEEAPEAAQKVDEQSLMVVDAEEILMKSCEEMIVPELPCRKPRHPQWQ